MARHVESVAGHGATSVVVTRQGVVEPHRIRRREWSKIVTVTAACQRVMETCRIRRREWSRVVAVTTACQGVQTCRLKFGWSLISTEARMGIICRGTSVETFSRNSGRKSGSRRSPDEVYLQ